MISVRATLQPGCFAKLSLPTVEKAVAYVRDHANQADIWEINGTPEEEAAIAKALKWNRIAA